MIFLLFIYLLILNQNNFVLSVQKSNQFIDIYTNYPHLREALHDQKFQLFSSNLNQTGTNNDQSTHHIQKISNSKQLEEGTSSGNFLTKINTVLRQQFSRLFKFGPPEAETNKKMDLEQLDMDKNKRFLNLFTILQFENSRCQTQSGGNAYEGTCFPRSDCAHRGGVAMDACARGYGVCCVFRRTCGGITKQNITYFECNTGGTPTPTIPPTTTQPPTTMPSINPRINITSFLSQLQKWPRQATGTGNTCILTVFKRRPDVKQLRIDFLDFDTRGPTGGTCLTDRLVITGGNINSQIPDICGYNTGQHVYVDVSDATGPFQIAVITANPSEKRFRIKVSQIRAPCANFMNCLQYYTGITGTVQTLNYDPSPRGLGPAQYTNNLNYAICIRKEPGYCTITYTNVQNGVESPFRFVNLDANGNPLIPPGQAGAEIFNCPEDYIVINGVRLCGERLNDGSFNTDFTMNAPVTDTSGGPFIIPVRTDVADVARGFKLFYMQNRCTAS